MSVRAVTTALRVICVPMYGKVVSLFNLGVISVLRTVIKQQLSAYPILFEEIPINHRVN